jgi:hypothetical protein
VESMLNRGGGVNPDVFKPEHMLTQKKGGRCLSDSDPGVLSGGCSR